MKWIRWPGLSAFLVVVALSLAVWWLLIDRLVERGIETVGSKLVGAKVELGAADVSFFPLGIELKRLQVTNPDEPMRNAVEANRIAFGMEALQLLRRKVIIDEMTIEGVRFNTERKTSGALVKQTDQKKEPKAASSFSLPTLDLPSARDILAKEDLESLKAITAVRADVDTGRERWKQRVAELPDKAKLDEYKRRFETIKSSRKGGVEGLLSGAGEAVELQKTVKQDLDRVKGAREDLARDVAALKHRIEEAAAAPQADVKRLKEKYTLSPAGLGNVAGALFGGEIGRWSATAATWYERLKPTLAGAGKTGDQPVEVKPLRGKGVDVRFVERQPLPDFLIRTVRVSVDIPAGIIAGQVRNITPDQDVLGLPLVFEFTGDKLQQPRSVALHGEINRVNPTKPRDTITLNVDGYRIEHAVLSDNPQWPVTLDGAQSNVDVKASITGDALDANVNSHLSGVHLSTGDQKASGRMASAIASALADVKALNLEATITGTTQNPDVKVTSDLDRVFKDAVGKLVAEQATQFEADLKTAIAERVNGPLEDLKKQLAGFGGLGDELASRSDALSGILSNAKLAPKGLKLPF
ncbi:MAG: TIGR03545 family protein [Nitrospirae bacterium]|nr:TIGR03545 family protein [Nitrospirota bacterium]